MSAHGLSQNLARAAATLVTALYRDQSIVETERPSDMYRLRTCTYDSTVDTERSLVLQYIYFLDILLVTPYELRGVQTASP